MNFCLHSLFRFRAYSADRKNGVHPVHNWIPAHRKNVGSYGSAHHFCWFAKWRNPWCGSYLWFFHTSFAVPYIPLQRDPDRRCDNLMPYIRWRWRNVLVNKSYWSGRSTLVRAGGWCGGGWRLLRPRHIRLREWWWLLRIRFRWPGYGPVLSCHVLSYYLYRLQENRIPLHCIRRYGRWRKEDGATFLRQTPFGLGKFLPRWLLVRWDPLLSWGVGRWWLLPASVGCREAGET